MTFDADKMRQDIRKVIMNRIGPEIEVDYTLIDDFKTTKPESQRLLSVIFIQNSAITFNLQISYSIKDALFFSNFNEKEIETKTADEKKAMAKDFINELCNMAGGGIKHLVEEEGVDSLISLPVATRTEDKDLFRPHPKGTSRVISDQWMIKNSEQSVLCYTKMEVFDEKAMNEKIVPAFGGGDDAGGGVFFL